MSVVYEIASLEEIARHFDGLAESSQLVVSCGKIALHRKQAQGEVFAYKRCADFLRAVKMKEVRE